MPSVFLHDYSIIIFFQIKFLGFDQIDFVVDNIPYWADIRFKAAVTSCNAMMPFGVVLCVVVSRVPVIGKLRSMQDNCLLLYLLYGGIFSTTKGRCT